MLYSPGGNFRVVPKQDRSLGISISSFVVNLFGKNNMKYMYFEQIVICVDCAF